MSDKIVSRYATEEYKKGWERIFNQREYDRDLTNEEKRKLRNAELGDTYYIDGSGLIDNSPYL